jgi:hypothetical protein
MPTPKKRSNRPRGRPPGTGSGIIQDTGLHMKVTAAWVKAIDDWRATQPDQPNRTEAIRRLVVFAIKHFPKA